MLKAVFWYTYAFIVVVFMPDKAREILKGGNDAK